MGQAYRLGNKKFFGPGSDFQIDSTKPVTVTTQFITNDGTDHGKLTDVKQFYTQNGKTVEHPSYTVNGNQHKTITDDFCKDWVAETQDGTNFLDKGGLGAMEKAIDAGVVLVMSLWDDHYANMLWLDSIYPVDSTDPGAHGEHAPPALVCQRMLSLSKLILKWASQTLNLDPLVPLQTVLHPPHHRHHLRALRQPLLTAQVAPSMRVSICAP